MKQNKLGLKIGLLVSILVNIIFFLMWITNYYEISFNWNINSIDSLAPVISILGLLVSLYFLINSQLINKETLDEIKQQRLDAVKPNILCDIQKIEVTYSVDSESFFVNSPKKESLPFPVQFINIGIDTSINLKIKYYYSKKEFKRLFDLITESYKKMNGSSRIYFKNHHKDYFSSISELENKLKSDDLFFQKKQSINYLEKGSDLRLSLPDSIHEYIKILSAYILFSDTKKRNLPSFFIQIKYDNILENDTMTQIYKIDSSLIIDKKYFLEKILHNKKMIEDMRSSKDDIQFLYPKKLEDLLMISACDVSFKVERVNEMI